MKNRILFSLILNILIVLFTILGIASYYFWPGSSGSSFLSHYHFYTPLSNILNGIICIIFIVFLILQVNKKIKNIHKYVYIVKHIGTTAVAITFFIVVVLLTPGAAITKTIPVAELYTNSSLFFHVLAPIFSIITFLLFEKNTEIKYPQTYFALIPISIYIIYYTTICCLHLKPDGTVDEYYDVYTFFSFGVAYTPLFCLAVVGTGILMAWLLWLGNKKINIKWLDNPLICKK